MQKIMESEGIELYRSNSKYYLRYDAGELSIKMKKLEISEEEAQNILANPDSAYGIILAYHDKRIYGDDS